ncbi:MAG: hypothetical protein QOJ00_921 [Actinomycetota bacterium]|jgi:AcrR family transcriptional regulator
MSSRARGRPSASEPTVATEALLDRALEMFAANGFDGMSVRELAREVGVSHNLIPQRIGSKEQLWFAAIDRGFGSLAIALAQAIAEQRDEADDLVRLRALLVRWVEANTTRPALLRIINQEATAPGPRLDYLFDRYIAPVREFGDELLARLAKDGKVRTSSAPMMYFLMTHGAGGPFILPALAARFGTQLDPSDSAAIHEHAVAVSELIFDGLVGPNR